MISSNTITLIFKGREKEAPFFQVLSLSGGIQIAYLISIEQISYEDPKARSTTSIFFIAFGFLVFCFCWVFWWDRDLNSGLHTGKTGALLLEPHLQSIILLSEFYHNRDLEKWSKIIKLGCSLENYKLLNCGHVYIMIFGNHLKHTIFLNLIGLIFSCYERHMLYENIHNMKDITF
jgi:hypothetical protein